MKNNIYGGLRIERALFDIRRGLPVFVNMNDSLYLLWAGDFFTHDMYQKHLKIYGKQGTGDVCTDIISGDNWTDILPVSGALLTLIKRSELSPVLHLTSTEHLDTELKDLIVTISTDDLMIMPRHDYHIKRLVDAKLPSRYSENAKIYAYRTIPGFYETYAIVFGDIHADDIIPIRLHAECFTGDLLGSLKCDCGPQLHKALQFFADKESGILIYLRQEGRNIGLLNKIHAYQLQQNGLDTVDANLFLGFEIDERDYTVCGLILQDLGVKSVSILTNNSTKINALESMGINVHQRMSHYTPIQKFNADYIATKQDKIGHLPE